MAFAAEGYPVNELINIYSFLVI